MDILIIDDEQLARDRLARMIQRQPEFRLVAVAASADDGLAAIEEHDPDIVLCDIRMPGKDGLELAKQLLAMEDPPALIFCTAYDQYALQAFGVQAVDYLLKPVSEEALLASLAKAQRPNRVQRNQLQRPQPAETRSHLQATSRRGVTLIPLNTIHFCRADQKYVTVVHDEGEALIDDSLKELEESFPDLFLRVHRNTLVAVERITSLQRNSDGIYHLCLRDSDQTVVVSRRHVAPVKAFLATL